MRKEEASALHGLLNSLVDDAVWQLVERQFRPPTFERYQAAMALQKMLCSEGPTVHFSQALCSVHLLNYGNTCKINSTVAAICYQALSQ